MGPVFRGEDGETRDPVVVKVIRVGLPPERVAIVGAALSALAERLPAHPALAPIIATGVVAVEPYVVSPFVDGDSLDVALREYGPANMADALPRLRQLADAMDAAAAVGAAHGSLHLRDIVVSVDQTMLTGVGMAAVLERVGVRPPVRRPYCAPEVALGHGISPAADQYALAAIAHEWLSGRRLSGSGAAGFQLPALSEEGAGELQAVFARAMHESADERFPTSTAFIDAVAALAGHAAPRPKSSRRAPAAEAPRLAFDDPAEPLDDVVPADELSLYAPAPSDPLDAFLDRPDVAAAMTLAAEDAPEEPAFSTVDDDEVDDDEDDDEVDEDAFDVVPVPVHDEWTAEPATPHLLADDPTFTDAIRADEDEPLALPAASDAEAPEGARAAWGGWALLLALVAVAAVAGGWLLLQWGTPAPRSAVTSDAARAGAAQGPSPSASAAPAAPAAVTPTPKRAAPPSVAPPAAAPSRPTATPRPAAPVARPSPPPESAPAAMPSVAPAGAAGRVLVRTTPGGAEVFINGERRGVTPLALRDLPFGAYTVRVVRTGYQPVEQRVAIDAGRPARSLEIALARIGTATTSGATAPSTGAQAPAAATAPGSLVVETRPAGARVFVDGVEIGTTPVTVERLAPGTHSVRIERPGYRPITTTARVEAGERSRVAVTLTAERPR